MEKELQKKKMENQKDNNDQKKDSSLSIVLFSSLAVILCIVVELYLMITMPELLPAIAVVGLAIVGCTYLCVATLVKRVERKEAEQKEQYASILKSEKASYLLIRKYFDEISEQLSLLEDKFSVPFQEVITAQKATAKVTINRNKENTDALMNSNDKLLDLIFQMESKLDEISGAVAADAAEQSRMQSQIEAVSQLSGQLREMELGLKNEILQAAHQMAMSSPQVVMAQPQPMPLQPQMEMPEEPGPLPDLMEEPEPELEPMSDLMEEPEPELELEPMAEEIGEPEPEVPDDEPVADSEPEPLMPSEPEDLTIPENVDEPEPQIDQIEELPPEPDLSDPNKMMSPDDIAALLASINNEANAEPEVVADEIAEDIPDEPANEPEVLDTQIVSEPEESVEEAPPMPDLSDPNKVMSPDEIAALFANLG